MLKKQSNNFNKSKINKTNVFAKHHFFANKDTYLLIGTPNVGKSTFFNKVSTGTSEISNFDRLTVAPNYGKIKKNKSKTIVDLPGIYNLSHPFDEEITVANFLIKEKFNKIINIIGATSIQRDLLLSIQAIETGLVSTIVINMVDEVNKTKLDINRLSKLLGNIKIVLAQANKNIGISEATNSIFKDNVVNSKVVKYDQVIENCIDQISKILPESNLSKRFLSLMILEKNHIIIDYLKTKIGSKYNRIQAIINKYKNIDFVDLLRSKRIEFVNDLLNKCLLFDDKKVTYFNKHENKKQRKFDRAILNGWIGIPLIVFLILIIYYLSFGPYAGGTLQTLFYDEFLTKIVNHKWLTDLFSKLFHPETNAVGEWALQLFTEGIFNGLFVVISFCIPITILFILINLIQQIGVMSRISVLLDQAFSKFGLSGRSVVNLLTGFGCNVTSILMMRSSNSKKERMISLLIAPFISCSSRTIVFLTISAITFSISLGWLYVAFLLFMSGIIALLIGLSFSKTMFRKSKSFFLVELVSWKKPDFAVIFKSVLLQLKSFIVKATTFILIANFIIWLFTHTGPSGILLDDKIDISFFGYIARGLNYLMYPLGGNSQHGYVGNNEGWKMTLSLITAFPAKEIALGNISILFAGQENFRNFVTQNMPIAISYMTIFLLYIPCAATISVLRKEGGWKLLFIHLSLSISISYLLGILSYWITYGIVMIH